MKNYDKKYCIYCGNEIKKGINVGIPIYYKRKFCRVQCQHKWNTLYKRIDLKCDFCGKEFRKKKSAIKKHNFCNSECRCKYITQIKTNIVICDYCGLEFRRRLSYKKTEKNFCSSKCMGLWQSKFRIGKDNNNWRNGKSTISHLIRSSIECEKWRQSVFEKDNYTCQKCGNKAGGNLNAHHKKSLSLIIEENNLLNIIDSKGCKPLWDINNGITLCEECHTQSHRENKNNENIRKTIQ